MMMNHDGRSFDLKTCQDQIVKPNPLMAMCWGAHDWAGVKDKVLLFKVRAAHFFGVVSVTLNWDDTYIVRFFKPNQEERTIHEVKDCQLDNIYCDMLASEIDRLIETEGHPSLH